jgi:hypothetical protein
VPGVEVSGPTRTAFLGDLAAGEIRDVIVPLWARGRRGGGAGEGVDGMAVAASVKLPLEQARRRADAASAILEAIRRARSGDVDGGLALLTTAEAQTRAAAEQLADPELAAFAERMKELKKSLASIAVAMLDQQKNEDGNAVAAAAEQAAPAVAPAPARAFSNERDVEVQMRSLHDSANRELRGRK